MSFCKKNTNKKKTTICYNLAADSWFMLQKILLNKEINNFCLFIIHVSSRRSLSGVREQKFGKEKKGSEAEKAKAYKARREGARDWTYCS